MNRSKFLLTASTSLALTMGLVVVPNAAMADSQTPASGGSGDTAYTAGDATWGVNSGDLSAVNTFGNPNYYYSNSDEYTIPQVGGTAYGTGAMAGYRDYYYDGFDVIQDSAAGGTQASAFGYYANAWGTNSTAVGAFANAVGDQSTAVGSYANATEQYTSAFGYNASATAYGATASGAGATASNSFATATGYNAQASGYGSVATGPEATASGYGAVATGGQSTASGTYATATGTLANATGENSTATGAFSNATQTEATATGVGANATGAYSTASGAFSTASGYASSAFGNGASATHSNSVAIGAGTYTDRDNSVAVGTPGNLRQITGVAPGTMGTDAVNVDQLQGVKKYATAGIAAAMAMPAMPPLEVGKYGVTFGVGGYANAVGLGAAVAARPSESLYIGAGITGSPSDHGSFGWKAQVSYIFP